MCVSTHEKVKTKTATTKICEVNTKGTCKKWFRKVTAAHESILGFFFFFLNKKTRKYFVYLRVCVSFAHLLAFRAFRWKGSLLKCCEKKTHHIFDHSRIRMWKIHVRVFVSEMRRKQNIYEIRWYESIRHSKGKRPKFKNKKKENTVKQTLWISSPNNGLACEYRIPNTWCCSQYIGMLGNLHEFLLHWMENQSMYLWH